MGLLQYPPNVKIMQRFRYNSIFIADAQVSSKEYYVISPGTNLLIDPGGWVFPGDVLSEKLQENCARCETQFQLIFFSN